MMSLILYVLRYLVNQVKLWWCYKRAETAIDKFSSVIRYSKHPEDFWQGIHAWWVFRKLTPSHLAEILIDDVITFCESRCDDIGVKDARCDFCLMFDVKPFFDKWFPDKAQLIGRLGTSKTEESAKRTNVNNKDEQQR